MDWTGRCLCGAVRFRTEREHIVITRVRMLALDRVHGRKRIPVGRG
jgi:hypothetical protein